MQEAENYTGNISPGVSSLPSPAERLCHESMTRLERPEKCKKSCVTRESSGLLCPCDTCQTFQGHKNGSEEVLNHCD